MAELAVETVQLPLRAPLHTAWGTLAERELVRVRLRFGPGDAGEGEAAPLEPYDGVPLALPVAKIVRERTDGPSLNGALAKTGMLQLVFCALLSVGLLAS